MWPSIENVTQPARRHVRVLTTQVIIASLQDKTPFLKDSSNDGHRRYDLKLRIERATKSLYAIVAI